MTATARVGFDARYLKRRDVGISVYLRELIEEALADDLEVTLCTDSPEHALELGHDFAGAKTQVLPGGSSLGWEQRALPRHLRQQQYDWYVAGANVGLPLAFRGPTRLMLVVHDLIPLRFPRTYLLGRPAWAAQYLASVVISLRRADVVLTNSHATRRDVARLTRSGKAVVRYPTIGEPQPDASGTADPLFVYNGGADGRKNVPALLRAFAQLTSEAGTESYVLWLIGKNYHLFSELIAELGLGDRVQVPGYVSDEEKWSLIGRAAAVVYPSSFEGFGLPVIEGFRMGTPVITGSGGSLREIGGTAVLRVEVTDPSSIAAAMREVLDPRVRSTRALAGYEQLRVLSRSQGASFTEIVRGKPVR